MDATKWHLVGNYVWLGIGVIATFLGVVHFTPSANFTAYLTLAATFVTQVLAPALNLWLHKDLTGGNGSTTTQNS